MATQRTCSNAYPLSFLQASTSSPRSRARNTYLALWSLYHNTRVHVRNNTSSQFRRSDFTNHPFIGTYEPSRKTRGPLGSSAILGVPRITPRVLKQHLDNYVIGQERAKKILSVAVFNHYQRINEAQRIEDEENDELQQKIRKDILDDESLHGDFACAPGSINLNDQTFGIGTPPLEDDTKLNLEKSNVLLLGPSGVGKTLMAKTLARVLTVPFSMSDCTPFTQAGYIGEDAEACIHRLLAAANYDVAAAERGIICLDEIDKISTTNSRSHGKDVSGEGVQQALLKLIEGTTVQVQAKPDRSHRGPSVSNQSPGIPLAGGIMSPPSGSNPNMSTGGFSSGPAKLETFNVRTDNILFICAGAFIGLQKIIMNRIAKGSIGFNSPIRSSSASSNIGPAGNDLSFSVKTGSDESKMFEKYMPFFLTQSPGSGSVTNYNPLDLVEPSDLQTYGMIPELVGRVPVSAALSALDEEALIRVLTEPRNSIIKQYEQLFQLSDVEVRFTRKALREIARASLQMGTGARGLRTVCERLLTETMFEAPGSSIKYVLISESVAQRKSPPIYFARGQQHKFHALIASEEATWDDAARPNTMDAGEAQEDHDECSRTRQAVSATH